MAGPRTLFLYGTLMDPEVLALVLGRDVATEAWAAVLPGFVRAAIAGRDFPGLWAAQGARTDGLTLRVGTVELMRLNAYEGPHYRLAPVEVVQGGGARTAALTYVSKPWVRRGAAWSLEAWQARHKAAYLRRWFG